MRGNKRAQFQHLIFLWDNFGPYHIDRVEAVHRHLSHQFYVVGIELEPQSSTYSWDSKSHYSFEKRTVFREAPPRSLSSRVRQIMANLPPARETCFFFCHYEDPTIFLVAILLRLRGGHIITMGNSKFDDKPRFLWREVGKSFFMLPYQGVFTNRERSKDYLRFLGGKKFAEGMNTVSLERIREQAGVPPAPNGPDFSERHFTCIARFVPKKNLSMLLSAYAHYEKRVSKPRALHLCGNGAEEAVLRQQAADLGIEQFVHFRGWLQDEAISRVLGQTLTLLLPSVEEQFGNVVIEAQAMGLPVILSDNCGARDLLVRSGVNGFVIEPDNPKGMAYFMWLLSEDESLWRRMCDAAIEIAPKGDVQRFVEGVEQILG